MADPTTLSEINNVDDCQLVSLTNKLPYYVKRLCKSTNKNKTAADTSKPREYLKENYNI
jgi:hypothetical protein